MNSALPDGRPVGYRRSEAVDREVRNRISRIALDTGAGTPARRLAIFVHGDFTLLENGAQRRTAELLHFLCHRFTNILVYSHVEHPTNRWDHAAENRFGEMFPNVELVLDTTPSSVRWLTKIKNIALSARPRSCRSILRWRVPGATKNYDKMCSRPDEFIFFVNFIDGYTLLNGFPFRSIIETHDVKFLKFAKRVERPVSHWRVLGKLRSESALLARAQEVVAISETDAVMLEALVPGLSCLTIPSYDDDDLPVVFKSETSLLYDFLFVGAHNVFNVNGLVAYLSANEDWLRNRSIGIAGRVCDAPEIKALAEQWPRLRLHGFVDDLAPLYAQSRIALAPVDGTGLNIKVLEALAHGRPVLGSRHALRALPNGYADCVFPLERQIADALLGSTERWHKAGTSARNYYLSLRERGDRNSLVQLLVGQRVATNPDNVAQPRLDQLKSARLG